MWAFIREPYGISDGNHGLVENDLRIRFYSAQDYWGYYFYTYESSIGI
jgi:hypothetical protein